MPPRITREIAWELLTEFTQSESLRKHAIAVEACMRACARKFSGDHGETDAFVRPAEQSDAPPSINDVLQQGNNAPYQGTPSCAPTIAKLDASYQGTPSGVPNGATQESRASAPEEPSEEALWGIVGLIHDFDYEQYPSLEDHPYKGDEILKERGWPERIRRAIMSHAEYTGVTRDTPMEKALFACDELAGFITAVALIKPGRSLAEVDTKSVRKRMKDKAFARKVNRDDIVNGAAALSVDLDEHIAFCIEAMKPIAGELGLGGNAAKTA